MKRYSKLLVIGVAFLVAVILLTGVANYKVIKSSEFFLTDIIENIPATNVGLLLGTSKKLKSGNPNEYFYNRIAATTELYKAGKIRIIIVSGDNSKKEYNEPADMKYELIKNGIPDSAIYLDYAGFRTFDSVVRAKEIFGQNKFTIISQKFHNERAVFIARQKSIEAYGYNAKDVNAYMGFKTRIREFFAKGKVYLDIIFGVDPRFLGEKVKLG